MDHRRSTKAGGLSLRSEAALPAGSAPLVNRRSTKAGGLSLRSEAALPAGSAPLVHRRDTNPGGTLLRLAAKAWRRPRYRARYFHSLRGYALAHT
jgi:hypothetical protein